jgi:hypothetical protein
MGMEHSSGELGKLDITMLTVEFGTVGLLLPRDGWVHTTFSQSRKRILELGNKKEYL